MLAGLDDLKVCNWRRVDDDLYCKKCNKALFLSALTTPNTDDDNDDGTQRCRRRFLVCSCAENDALCLEHYSFLPDAELTLLLRFDDKSMRETVESVRQCLSIPEMLLSDISHLLEPNLANTDEPTSSALSKAAYCLRKLELLLKGIPRPESSEFEQ